MFISNFNILVNPITPVYVMLCMRSSLILCKIWFGIFIKLLNRRFETSRVGDDVEYPFELYIQYMYIKTT